MRPGREKGEKKMPDVRDENNSAGIADHQEIDDRIPVFWVVPSHDYGGNALGYNSHNSAMLRYCAKYFRYTPEANIAIHIVPANFFRPIPGKFNVLFTMWEAIDVPPVYKEKLPLADLVIVPCKFCKNLFDEYTKQPCVICYEGVEPLDFPFYQRRFPNFAAGERFRYLWLGAPNPRKGYPQILEITNIAKNHPNIEIYMKTTTQKMTVKSSLRAIWKNRKDLFKFDGFPTIKKIKSLIARLPRPGINNQVTMLGAYKNIIFDTRKLPKEELTRLYQSAHCFILPSWGEGWGLTLCEAMATGAPCVSVSNTGTADFFDETVGYVIKDEIVETEFQNYDFRGRIHFPMMDDFLRKTVEVYQNYAEALKKGRKASQRIHRKFTWERAASRLNEIIGKVAEDARISHGVEKVSQ